VRCESGCSPARFLTQADGSRGSAACTRIPRRQLFSGGLLGDFHITTAERPLIDDFFTAHQ
jgi:hypothetical protein